MSTDGDGEGPPPVKKKKRVTLKWERGALLLPGEAPPEARTDESGELAMPDLATLPSAAEAAPRPASPENPAGHDGWERQRPVLTPPPPPPPPTTPPTALESDGGALSLVDTRGRASSPSIDLATEMADRFALGDYTAALRVAELLLGRRADHEAALQISAACREKLAQLYVSRLGPLQRVPKVAVEPTDVRWLGLDHKAGFLLSQVDGAHSLEELLDVSGMGRLEALKLMVELLEMGAIRFEG